MIKKWLCKLFKIYPMKLENLEEAHKLMKERQAYLHAASLINIGSQVVLSKANTKGSPGGYHIPFNLMSEGEVTAVKQVLVDRAERLRNQLMELGVEV
jgi:hypothetical protein